jgi:hypothetical protein
MDEVRTRPRDLLDQLQTVKRGRWSGAVRQADGAKAAGSPALSILEPPALLACAAMAAATAGSAVLRQRSARNRQSQQRARGSLAINEVVLATDAARVLRASRWRPNRRRRDTLESHCLPVAARSTCPGQHRSPRSHSLKHPRLPG